MFEYMTLAEVAELLRCNRQSVSRAIAAGEIAAVRIGRQYLVHRDAIAGLAVVPDPVESEPTGPDTLLTVADAALFLKCHEQTVRSYIHAGRLPSVRVGKRYRIRRADLEAGVQPVEVKRTYSGGFRQKAREMP